MVKLESLKKSNQFKKALKERKIHTEYFSVFAAKNFFKPKYKTNILMSFVMKKKIGNAVKRNKIRRKLKANVQKLLKKKGAINRDYTYIVFGKSNAYAQKQNVLLQLMERSFSKLKKQMTKILIFIIKIYQYFVSPFLGNRCRFFPTCSEYCIEALKTHGLFVGLKLAVKRILKCHPFKKLGGENGIDFVPVSNNKESNNG